MSQYGVCIVCCVYTALINVHLLVNKLCKIKLVYNLLKVLGIGFFVILPETFQ